jgi:UDP-N-acetylglucosamine 2-epimerase (non-hydrolysing)/GDP/UDP-N,N'-diacetylbacillosamine 2-epimerase (hydrolysing)
MPSRKRRIAVVTGTRAEYGILESTLREIDQHPRLALRLVVAGMHLLRKFGLTVRQIERDGWRIAARVRMQRGDDSPTDQALGLSRGISGMAAAFERIKPDVVLVLGDRIEALAGALAAVTTGRIVAHIHGGDVAEGDFDESLRHAITKLAHLHFPATQSAARRIVRMGEPPQRVWCVGAPGLDRLRELMQSGIARNGSRTSSAPLYALVIQHACGRPADVEERAARLVLEASASAGLHRHIIGPNSDRGHRGVLRAIERHLWESSNGDALLQPSLPRDEFLTEMLGAAVVVGNSSCGIIEAPSAGVPSVNIGRRQAGRERGGSTVIDAPENARAIQEALRRAGRRWTMPRETTSSYGDGSAGERIASILARVELTEAVRRKRFAGAAPDRDRQRRKTVAWNEL